MSQRDGIIDIWGPRTPTAQGVPWPARLDSNGEVSPERWVQSACVLCSNGCGLDIGVSGGRIVGVRGRVADRVSRGRLGPKGLNAWVANNSEDRLTRPLVRRDRRLEPASWDEAMSLIVDRTRAVREKATANAIGFYTSGQLLLEEYYTLAVIGKAGLGTPHMDGNTRLCTATAGQALKETFGSDGQPASYTDIEATDALFLVGHNMAATQTVLWSRILDRRRGQNPPKLVVLDPRVTPTAQEADIHLAPAVGTNVAVLNGLLALIVESGQIDVAFVETRTIGFGPLRERVRSYTPERVYAISGVPIEKLRAAAKILGGTPTLLSTCLQGVYQSVQATAAAVQVNNLNLIRGLIGHPGSGVLQMNGQPTAQNTRESGANGDMPAFRNWNNPKHIAELAELWNVEIDRIPHWAPPTHASQIFRYCETGSIQMLWISATNPLVSMPDLNRMRRILSNPALFLVVQDAFLTETAKLADVVLPAAIWGEKTGCFTNVDRTVHISHKAVEPPGEARADLDIFLDFARRMGLHDKDGMPLIKWTDAEGAFNAWRECTRGKRCDYSGLSYAKLSGGSGIQWPCDDLNPSGTERLYSDHVFPTQPDACEDYGHDLDTGAQVSRERYMDAAANGRAILKSADWRPPQEMPDADFPFMLTTGRVTHHFHTRTKTGRSEKLNAAAPDAFVQLAEDDARQLGIIEGEAVRVTSRRGHIIVAAKVGEILRGHVFVPFHYGYWDEDGCARAANELTILEWDPVSKQPHFKYAAVRIEKSIFAEGAAGEAGDTSSPAAPGQHLGQQKRAHVADYIGLLHASEDLLCRAFKQIRDVHASEPDIASITTLFEAWPAGLMVGDK
jgi:ferredoxin-nitrate reductase